MGEVHRELRPLNWTLPAPWKGSAHSRVEENHMRDSETGIGVDDHEIRLFREIAKILFTSGSTGSPKGVLNTHRMLAANQRMIGQAWPFLRQERPVIVDWLAASR
jgi:acyl-CoA synthetase (AMP-forming)/AMP-acid ligase II